MAGESNRFGDYFVDARGRVDEWIFGTAPEAMRGRLPKFQVPRFHRPIGEWLNLLVAAGFTLERFAEPCPSEETVRVHPTLQGLLAQLVLLSPS